MAYVQSNVAETAKGFFEHDLIDVEFDLSLSEKEKEIAHAWLQRDLETGVLHKIAWERENFGK